MNWPTQVPILEASDICRGTYDGKTGTHCLAGWVRETFGEKRDGWAWNDLTDKVESELVSESKAGGFTIASYNDKKKNSLAKLAKLWNRTMAKLGYVVGNPEARKARKKAKA